MSRPTGLPKTGGRKAGVPNKRSQALRDQLNEKFPGWDPVLQLAGMAQDEDTPVELRVRCASEVAPYIHAKRRSVEHSGEGVSLVTFQVNSPFQPPNSNSPLGNKALSAPTGVDGVALELEKEAA